MPGIITSRTRSLYHRPPPQGGYCLNQDSPQAVGLHGWWPMNESGGQTCFDMVNRNHARVTGGTLVTAPCRFGGAGRSSTSVSGTAPVFSGTPDYYEATLPSALVMPLTLSCWFWTSTVAGNRDMVSVGVGTGNANGWTVRTNVSARVGAETSAAGSSSTASSSGTPYGVVVNHWYHATAVFLSSTSRTGYLDGQSPGNDTTSRATSGTTNVLRLGALADTAAANGVIGQICHACLWKRALNPAEIMGLYEPTTRWDLYYETGLKAYSFAPPPAATAKLFRQAGLDGLSSGGPFFANPLGG